MGRASGQVAMIAAPSRHALTPTSAAGASARAERGASACEDPRGAAQAKVAALQDRLARVQAQREDALDVVRCVEDAAYPMHNVRVDTQYGYGTWYEDDEYRLQGTEHLYGAEDNLMRLAGKLTDESERKRAQAASERLSELRLRIPSWSSSSRYTLDQIQRDLELLSQDVSELAKPYRAAAQAATRHADELGSELASARAELAQKTLSAQVKDSARQTVSDLADAACAPQSPVAMLFAGHRAQLTAQALREAADGEEVTGAEPVLVHARALAGELERLGKELPSFTESERDQHDGRLARLAVELAAFTELLSTDALVDEDAHASADPFAAVLGARRGAGLSARELAAHLAEGTTTEHATRILQALELLGEDERIPWP